MARILVLLLLMGSGQAWACADARKPTPEETRKIQDREALETARIRNELAAAEKRARTPQERAAARRKAQDEMEKLLAENPLRWKCVRQSIR